MEKNSVLYECFTDDELIKNYNNFISSDWWKKDYKTENPIKAWLQFQIEMEEESWAREGIDAKLHIEAINERIGTLIFV